MSLSSLALDSAVESRVNSSVAHPSTARQWYRFLYSPHMRNKHHQRTSDGTSTSSKLGQLLVHPRDVQWFAGCLSKYQEIGVFRLQPQNLICMLRNTILAPRVQFRVVFKLFSSYVYVQRAERCCKTRFAVDIMAYQYNYKFILSPTTTRGWQ